MLLQASLCQTCGLGGCSRDFQRSIGARCDSGEGGWSGRLAAGQLGELPVPLHRRSVTDAWELMRAAAAGKPPGAGAGRQQPADQPGGGALRSPVA